MTQPKQTKTKTKPTFKASPHTRAEVIEEWKTTQPEPKLAFFHIAGKDVEWDSNFTITYEVILDGWRYVVQAHVHDYRSPSKRVSGKSFVPGFDGDLATPAFVRDQAPAYDPNTHQHGWSSDPDYQSKLYKGAYRYPTEL
jgi:hypothetical protein